jgi:hypothetical protein
MPAVSLNKTETPDAPSTVATMTERASANLEVAILLPLGVVANQLLRIEAQLRLLNMKAWVVAEQGDNEGRQALIGSRLENINATLDAIKGLVTDIETDLQPKFAEPAMADARSSNRKPRPERDD